MHFRIAILSPVLKSEVADKASINIEYKKGSKKSENIYYRRWDDNQGGTNRASSKIWIWV